MRKEVRDWFLENQRVFPWRQERTPYRVLVSEMMLQQTRASVVIAYFERWMARFPTIDALAKGEEGEVIKLWEGLGYYSRARNLLRIAKMGIPDTYEGLLALPGVGAYTAGAVWAFGFGKKGCSDGWQCAAGYEPVFCL